MKIRYTVIFNTFLILTLIFLTLCSKKTSTSKNNTTPAQKQLESILMEKSKNSKQTPIDSKNNGITIIDGLDKLNTIIENTPDTLLVFDFYADWCMPCKRLFPLLDSLATLYSKNVSFFKVDVDHHQEVATAFRVQSIPLVVFIKNKEIVHTVTGLNSINHYEKIISTCGSSISAAQCKEDLKKIL